MTNTQPDNRLASAARWLDGWMIRNAAHCKGRCLEAVRAALVSVKLALPKAPVRPGHHADFAIDCGKLLSTEAAKFGWKLVGTTAQAIPQVKPSLVFFDNCGDGCGHISIYLPAHKKLAANEVFAWSDWWASRVAYVFLPV